MKKHILKNLHLRKKVIVAITQQQTSMIKGGTEPVSAPVPMSQAPDRNGICYAIK